MVSHRKRKRTGWLVYTILGLIAVGSVFIINLNYQLAPIPPVPPAAVTVTSPLPYAHHVTPEPQMAAERFCTVQPGDTLWTIARKFLGTGTDWPQLYTMNRETIGASPDVIHAGEKLKL